MEEVTRSDTHTRPSRVLPRQYAKAVFIMLQIMLYESNFLS